jgi:hypothetical protein
MNDAILDWLSFELEQVRLRIEHDKTFHPSLYSERAVLDRLVDIRREELKLLEHV